MGHCFEARLRLLSGVLLLGLLASCARLDTVPPEEVGLSSKKLAEVHSLLEGLVAKKRIAGAVGLVVRRGKIAYFDPVGFQDAETGTPMRPDTIFRVCSMTKPITSVAVMMLAEDGGLSLSDPLSKFIPEFAKVQVAEARPGGEGGKTTYQLVPAEREVTIRDLLTHTSGLTYGFWGREYLGKLYKDAGISDGLVATPGTIGDNARKLAALPLKHQPGVAWEYGLSTDVLGRVVEVVSKKTLDEFFRERIFEPLGMKDTHFAIPADKRPRLAAAYEPREGDQTIRRIADGVVTRGSEVYSASYPYDGSGKYFSGGAGLVSTVPDYARFCLMLLGGGELDGVRLLKKETVELMTRDQCEGIASGFEPHGDAFGFGFGVVTPKGAGKGMGSVGSFSWGGFFHTYFFVDPREELVGIVMDQLHPWGDLKLWDDFRRLVYEAVVRS